MDRIKCFWLEATELVSLDLRRFVFSEQEKCSASKHGYHDVTVNIGQGPKDAYPNVFGDKWDHTDPRWPTTCSCGYHFKESDQWQFRPHPLYRRVDTGELFTQDTAPAGAMLHGEWMLSRNSYTPGADGILLVVKLPDNAWWCVDGPSYTNGKTGPGWTRTGEVPNVSARPSIQTAKYHGYLTDGYLLRC